MSKITIRFVAGNDLVSWFIRFQAGIAMPFTPNHVESLSPDGKWLYGEHIGTGLQKRPVGYDTATTERDFYVDIPCTAEQQDAYYAFLESKVNMPYDWRSIISFIVPSLNLHGKGSLICSAITADAMRQAKVLPWWLTVPFHHLSPRDILLICSVLVDVPHPEMPL